jgi:hypothetical protein
VGSLGQKTGGIIVAPSVCLTTKINLEITYLNWIVFSDKN